VKDAASLAPTLAFAPWATALLAVCATGTAVASILLRRTTRISRPIAILVPALSRLVASQVSLVGFDEFRGARSSEDIITAAEQVNARFARNAPFFNVRMFDQTVPLVLRRTTTLVEYRDEFALGEVAEPGKSFANEADRITGLMSDPLGGLSPRESISAGMRLQFSPARLCSLTHGRRRVGRIASRKFGEHSHDRRARRDAGNVTDMRTSGS
jgi:hypothetical protein